jgi:hypothetical protein
MSWIEDARAVVDEHQARKVNGMLLDAFTASMLVQVHDALSETNRRRFAEMPLLRAVTVGWKLVH